MRVGKISRVLADLVGYLRRATAEPVIREQVNVWTLQCRAAPLPSTQEKGYRILKIQGDGRCMFRALVRCLQFCLLLSL